MRVAQLGLQSPVRGPRNATGRKQIPRGRKRETQPLRGRDSKPNAERTHRKRTGSNRNMRAQWLARLAKT